MAVAVVMTGVPDPPVQVVPNAPKPFWEEFSPAAESRRNVRVVLVVGDAVVLVAVSEMEIILRFQGGLGASSTSLFFRLKCDIDLDP